MRCGNGKYDDAIVELYSTLLLLALTVIFFGAISYFSLNSLQSSPGPLVTISGTMLDNNIVLEHRGGEPISLTAIIGLNFNTHTAQFCAYDFADDQVRQDGKWGFGEKIVYPIYKYYSDYFEMKQIDIMVVNKDTGSSIFFGSTLVEPSSDLSLEISVDQKNPKIGAPIRFTITLRNNGNVNVSGATVRFKLPEGLLFAGFSTTNGSYDNTSALWYDIGRLHPDQSVVLEVTAVVKQVIPSEFTQLLIIQDGSGSIRKSDWALAINGFMAAIGNASVCPQNGVVELTFVQFGGNSGTVSATVNIQPTAVTSENVASLVTQIKNIKQMVGLTSTACGLLCGTDALSGSQNFSTENRQVVLLITDGKASSICNIDGDYKADPPTGVDALTSAVQARNYLLDQLEMDPLQDELDVIAVHVTEASAYTWFKNDMVWPQPGYFAPPFLTESPRQGFVMNVSSWAEFPVSLQSILVNILFRINVEGDIIQSSVIDPKSVNNFDTVIIRPQV